MSRVLKKSGLSSENKCHKTPESQIQKSYNIKNLVDWGEISTDSARSAEPAFALPDKTWTNAGNSRLSTCLKDTFFTPQKLHSHGFKFRRVSQ